MIQSRVSITLLMLITQKIGIPQKLMDYIARIVCRGRTEKYFSKVRLKGLNRGWRSTSKNFHFNGSNIDEEDEMLSLPRKVHVGGRHLCPLRCFHYGEHYVTMEEKVGKGIEKEREGSTRTQMRVHRYDVASN